MDLKKMAAQEARRHGIPENIFYGLIKAESSWRPDAVSHAGAMGLTQVMPGTARGMGYDPDELARNPAIQLEAGAKYLSQMHDQFGNWELALAAYNAGPGNVQKYGGVPPFKETQEYVPRVMRFAQEEGGGRIPDFNTTASGHTPGTAVDRSTGDRTTVDLSSLLPTSRLDTTTSEARSPTDILESLTASRRGDDSSLSAMPTVPLTKQDQPLIPDRSKMGAPDTGMGSERKDALDSLSKTAEPKKPEVTSSPRMTEQKEAAKSEPENIKKGWQAWIGGLLRGAR